MLILLLPHVFRLLRNMVLYESTFARLLLLLLIVLARSLTTFFRMTYFQIPLPPCDTTDTAVDSQYSITQAMKAQKNC